MSIINVPITDGNGPDQEFVEAAAARKTEALLRARRLIEHNPCTSEMKDQVIKDLILIEELRRDFGV